MTRPPTTGDTTNPLIEAYFEVQHLKQLYRQGWLRRGVGPEHAESVADHTFATALLAILLADHLRPELDAARVLRLALLHDLGEAHAGDLTPGDGVPPTDKHRLERESVRRILGKLPGGDRHLALWEEYEQGHTPEARFVRQIDRLEMALQALVYETQGHGDLDEFMVSAGKDVEDPELTALMDEIRRIHTHTR